MLGNGPLEMRRDCYARFEVWHRKHSNTAGTPIHSATIYFGNSNMLDTPRWIASRRWMSRAQHGLWCTLWASPSCVCRSVESLDFDWPGLLSVCLTGVSCSYSAVAPWEDYEVHSFRPRLSVIKSVAGLELVSEESCVVYPRCPSVVVFVEAMDLWWLHSCQLIVVCLALCRISEMNKSKSGYTRTSSVLVPKWYE